MKKRIAFRIQLTSAAKDRLCELSDGLELRQFRLTEMLLEWFAAQPDVVRCAILGLYPESIRQDVATLILARMEDAAPAAGKSASLPIDTADDA